MACIGIPSTCRMWRREANALTSGGRATHECDPLSMRDDTVCSRLDVDDFAVVPPDRSHVAEPFHGNGRESSSTPWLLHREWTNNQAGLNK